MDNYKASDISRFMKVKHIVEQALALPEDERNAFISNSCQGDAQMLMDAETLIRAPAAATTDFQQILRPEQQEETDYAGSFIGPYRLVEELGRGGMGVVYKGVRDDGELRMTVAVKLVKNGWNDPNLIARFKRERQLLADLRHANIARLLDAGATSTGDPYFIMEFVEGVSIDNWARDHKLDLRKCLLLFRKVLNAVALAHSKGVIHRDIKPANVLVTADGEPILLDFGIAHTANQEDNSGLTRDGNVALTPSYAAPEQLVGMPVSPRFDIYALGLLLLEIRTGKRLDRRLGTPEKVVREMARRAAVDTDATSLIIPAPLAEILANALAEDPARRYANCKLMLDDLDMLLDTLATQSSSILTAPFQRRASTVDLPGDALAIDSPFYIERPPVEIQCYEQVLSPGSLIRIKAPWQMGKTSLLMRLCHHAELAGRRTVIINLQIAEKKVMSDLDAFLKWFCAVVSRKLGVSTKSLNEFWDDIFGAKDNCTAWFEESLLPDIDSLVLALDEVDRIFAYPDTAREFLSLMRVWHEQGKTSEQWRKISLIVAHTTEIYIPMDINQSPFNVGFPVSLPELSDDQLLDLAACYDNLEDVEDLDLLTDMIGGHPHLAQLTFHQLSNLDMDLEDLFETAATEQGIFADHLKRHLRFLEQNPDLAAAMSQVVNQNGPVRLDSEKAFKLASLGLVTLSGNDVTARCNLYRLYFKDRLE